MVIASAQVPEREDSVQFEFPSGRSVQSAVSNGYGQHVSVAHGEYAEHYLIANSGATVFQSTNLGRSFAGVTAVTSYGSYVDVANRCSVGVGHDVIRLWRSSDGGEGWPAELLFTFDPADSFSNQTITAIDANADGGGVHIVWESSSEVYYVRFREATQQFRDAKRVTDVDACTGSGPKVVTSTNKVHVSFLRTDLSPKNMCRSDTWMTMLGMSQ